MYESVELYEYLPPVLQRVQELMRICEIEQQVLTAAETAMEQVLLEQFAAEAGEYGIARWEKMLGIVPPAGVPAAERRRIVQLRLGEQLPFTWQRLREMLSAVVSEDEYLLELIPGEYRLKVRLALSGKGSLNEVAAVLRRVLPANILLDMALLYNTHGIVQGKTHGELAALTHREIREEVFE
ncbi:MAG: DUF2313 domain-containing protein [Firmicutes bacterium]|nr:DUF2313 domain-containing protein [Bacillota bacterium]